MGSKLGFGELLGYFKVAENDFLMEGAELAKEEFNKNFDSKSDKGDDEGFGGEWAPLISRNEPPPMLELTGRMREKTVDSPIQIGNGFSLFIIDPIDKRGRGYAEYHDQGTQNMPQRRTIVQSKDLDFKQLNALMRNIDKAFNR